MSDPTPALSLACPEAAQWNKDLMQAFLSALDTDPAADLLSIFPRFYRRQHRYVQYTQQSYAGQINLRTLHDLQDDLERDPEVDLLSVFPKNYTRRITMATGPKVTSKKDPSPIRQSPGYRERLDLAKSATIVFPLSEEVTALLSPYPADDDDGAGLLQSLKQLLSNSPSLWDDKSRGIVVKCSDNIVAKVIMGTDEYTEYTTLQYLAEHMSDIPAPTPHGLIAFAPFRVVFMSYIPDMTLTQAWPTLTHEEKVSIQHQLDEIFRRLRNHQPPPDGKPLGGVGGEGVKEMRVAACSTFKDIMTVTDFSNLQFSIRHHGSRTYVGCLRSLVDSERERERSTCEQELVFTHGDVRTDNIMVKREPETQGYVVSGIIDWEYSGFYPGYYECTALTRTMGVVDEDDWFLYLPDCIAPGRFPVCWLVDRLWGIHLWTT